MGQVTPDSVFCNYFPTFLMSQEQMLECTALPATSIPPTPGTLNSTATQAEAQATVNTLATQTCPSGMIYSGGTCVYNDDLSDTVSALIGNTGPSANSDPLSYFENVLDSPAPAVPFCGAGSVQWIAGYDNCDVLFGIGVTVVGIMVLASFSKGRRR
jgi:hypothetical protein